MSDVLVIIPAYNEGERLAAVLQSIRDLGRDWDLLVVDDGSSDRTAQIAADTGAFVVSHTYNLGYGAALQTGYKFAASHGYRFVVQMDADGQHLPEETIKLLDPVQADEADVVIGSRFLDGGGGYPVPLLRKVGIGLFGGLAGLLSGATISDATSGFYAVNRKVIVLFASDVFPADYPDADVRLMLHKLKLRVRELPTTMKPGPPDKSMHGGLRSLWYVVKMMISLLIVWITRFTPPVDKEGSA